MHPAIKGCNLSRFYQRSMLGNKIHAQYDITKFMGLGRFGETYLAKSKELPGQPQCVLKRYRPQQVAQPFALIKKSFEVQCELLYQLGQHDQIPRILAKIEDEPNLYLVQEYIDGQMLNVELVPEQQWNQAQVVGFLQDTLGILEFIHHQNFIHQDINPKNLIRRWRDGKFVLLGCSGVKDVTGIWKQPIDDSPIELIGTPGYIPFEQEEGNPQLNTDIYALGVIAIQSLTGTGEIEKNPDTYQLSWQHLTSANLKLVAIIDRMVRPDYRNRYQLAREVSDDLRSFMQSQIQPSPWDNLRPHLIFGAAATALLIGLAIPKILPGGNEQISPNSTPANAKLPASNSPVVPGPDSDTAPAGIPVNREPIAYQNKQIQINYDPQWQKEEHPDSPNGEIVTFWSPQEQSSLRPNLTISILPLPEAQMNLAKYTEQSIAELQKSLTNPKVIESRATKLANQPAHQIYYSGKPTETAELQSLETWTIVNGKVYLLSYRAQPTDYASYLPSVIKSINSFKLLNDQ
jgi:eukaryotic-like serine/threonine-protein kinase